MESFSLVMEPLTICPAAVFWIWARVSSMASCTVAAESPSTGAMGKSPATAASLRRATKALKASRISSWRY